MDAIGIAIRIFYAASCYLLNSLLPCLKQQGGNSKAFASKCCGERKVIVSLNQCHMLCRLQRQYANLQLNCTVVEFNTLSEEFLAAKEVTWLIQSVSDYTDAHSVLSISMMKTLFFKLLIPTRYLSCVTHCITFLCCSYLPHLSESYLYCLTFSIIM